MSGTPDTASIESLLQHGGYLRALARKLTLDDERAEDLVQQVWLTVLERRALPAGSPRAWLHVVLRNLAFRSRSRELERPVRERQAARPEAQELDGDADLDTRQLVIEVLRGLRQPYRQTLYLRYVRDLSPTEIAEREAVPVATVKTRLQRGIAMMREELDRRSGGDWRAWCVPVLGLAELERSGALGLLRWRLACSVALRVGLALTLATGGALLALIAVRALRPPAPAVTPATSALTPEPTPPPSPRAPRGAATPAKRAPRVALGAPPIAAPGLSGRVLHPDGEPIEGARVRLAPRTGSLFTQRVSGVAAAGGAARLQEDLRVRWPAEARVVFTDEDGSFELRGDDLADRELTVSAEGAAQLGRRLPAVLVLPHDLGDLQLEPPVVVGGRVLDASGDPIVGARFWAPVVERMGDQRFELHGAGGELLATSDEEGSFWIEDLPSGAWSFAVESDDSALLQVQGDTARGGREQLGLTLTAPEPATIRGRLTGIPTGLGHPPRVVASAVQRTGELLSNETVFQSTSSRTAELDAEGRFELRGLWAGADYSVQAQLGGETRPAIPCSATVPARAGGEDVRLEFAEAPSLSLRIVDARDGRAIDGAQVAILIEDEQRSGVYMARSDAQGRCRITTGGAPRGRLFIEHERYAPLDRSEFELVTEGEVELALEPEAVLSVRVVDRAERPVPGRLVVATPATPGSARRARTDADGRALFRTLAAGVYELASLDPQAEREPEEDDQRFLVPLAPSAAERTIRLLAGEREEVVLRVASTADAAGPRGPRATLGGRLVDDAGAPIAGAEVRALRAAEWEARALPASGPWKWERDLAQLDSKRVVLTDADGRFVLREVEAGADLLLALDALGYARRIVPVAALSNEEERFGVEVRTLAGSELLLFVEDPKERVLFLRLRAEEPSTYPLPLSSVVDERGEVRMLDLPAGTWRAELFELVGGARDAAPLLVWSDELALGAGELRELSVELR